MTHEEKLKAVTEDIRRELPELMKLEKGCILKYDDDFIEICKKLPKTSKYNDNFYQGFSYDDNCGHWFYENQIEDLGYKIIGKEPMLNDVIDWFYLKGIYFSFSMYNSQIKKEHIKWDFSKPYLKDQSEEFINFLYELLEK